MQNVMHVLDSMICGFLCQPRFNCGDDGVNGAGEVLEGLLDVVHGYDEAIHNIAKAATPTTKDDVYWCGLMILLYEAENHPDLNRFAVIVASLARDAAAVLFRQGGVS